MEYINQQLNKISRLTLLELGMVVTAFSLLGIPVYVHADTLNRQLDVYSRGSDVSALQTFLSRDATIYPQGLVTGYYGFLTKAAVSNFQSRNNINAVGRVGPITLPVINLQIPGGVSKSYTPAPTITNVAVSASDTSAIITWRTVDIARGKLYYSTDPIRIRNMFDATGVHNIAGPSVSGTLATHDDIARLLQQVKVENLQADTTYYYLIQSFNAVGDISITLPDSFHTSK